jgi:3-hydroxybutyryl-CoA dehydrogenase
MGSGIAARSALAKNKTILIDRNLEYARNGLAGAKNHIKELFDNGFVKNTGIDEAAALLFCSEKIEEPLPNVRLVIEAINEDLSRKQELFALLDGLLPQEVPIVSNTSGLRITDIAAKMNHPQRAFTGHFWFPAHLVPLVEVVVGDKSDMNMALELVEEFKRWGKEPVLMGMGGSIPMIAEFQQTYPGAEVLCVGTCDPNSRIHGIDESLELADLRKFALAEALLLEKLAKS